MINCSTIMRLLCLAWLGPAVSLLWIGFATVGIRTASRRELDLALDRIQAAAVLLALFGWLMGLLWSLRTLEYLPSARRIGSGSWLGGPIGHGVAAIVSMITGLAATVGDRVDTALVSVAVIAGFYALLFVTRWLLRIPLDPAMPLALLSVGAAFQVTVGWLHVLHPTGALAPLLVVEGVAMAWMALAASRVVATAGAAAAVVAEERVVETISQAPTQPSLPEPAVGR